MAVGRGGSEGGAHAVDSDAITSTEREAGTRNASRDDVVGRQKEEHGGIKFGSAFFGWLTATGMAVLLTALAAAAGAVFGLSSGIGADDAADTATQQADTVGIIGGIVLLVIVLVAYYCGGYVAGRMARFDGVKQGLAVWLWALIIAVVVGVISAIAGAEFNILTELNSFPRLPVGEGTLTTAGIVALVAVLVVTW